MTFEFVVLLLAAAQAFLLGVLTFQKHRALYANRFLSLMMFVCGFAVLHILLQDYGFYDNFPDLLYVVLGIPFLVAPLHFFYTKYLVTRAAGFERKDWLHLLPAAGIEAAVLVMVIVAPGDIVDPSAKNVALVPLPFHIYNWVLVIQGIVYASVSLAILMRYRRKLKDVASSLENIRLTWLMYLTLAALTTWIIFLSETTLLTLGINLSNYMITSICGALYVYTTGYFGLLKSEVFAEHAVANTMHEVLEESSKQNRIADKYGKSGLDEKSASLIMERLLRLMEEKKPYTNSTLTLAQLAAMLSVTSHNLSEVINTRCRQNFYDFVNRYRVEQVKRNLSDPAKKNLKILTIAFDAGFNSKASFNEVFKALTELTPSEYRRRPADKNVAG